MPYSSASELPPAVRKLPEKGQHVFMAAFNSAHAQHPNDEATAFKIAWSAAENAGYKPPMQKAYLDKEVVFKSIDKAKQLVYGVVLEPDTEDSQGDIISTDEIEKTAHAYLRNSRVVGRQHMKKANAEVVESVLAPCDMLIGETKISKGSWVLGVKVNDPAMWAEVESGDLTGFSIGGVGERVPLNG